jgi:hypothetical protein
MVGRREIISIIFGMLFHNEGNHSSGRNRKTRKTFELFYLFVWALSTGNMGEIW